jgi:hypothetical protein
MQSDHPSGVGLKRWEYHIESFAVTERWSSKKQADEFQKVTDRLNALGAEGWELIAEEAIILKGGITGSDKGQLSLCFFKRSADATAAPQPG